MINSRAKQACDHCKAQKVRCDSVGGEDCSQCIDRNIDCVRSPPLKRGRKPKACTEANGEGAKVSGLIPLENFYFNSFSSISQKYLTKRIQCFNAILPFYPFFRFKLDPALAVEVWNTFHQEHFAWPSIKDQALVLSYIEHALVIAYGCLLVNDFQQANHFALLQENLFKLFEQTGWQADTQLVSRLIEALLLRLDFESVAIKDATSLANTFNVIHELSTRPAHDGLINPHAKFRILSIYLLSLSQDIHGILNKLTSFPPEIALNPGHVVTLLLFMLTRYYDPDHQGTFQDVGKGKERAELPVLHWVLNYTNEVLTAQKAYLMSSDKHLYVQYECGYLVAKALFDLETMGAEMAFLDLAKFVQLIQSLPFISYHLRDCLIVSYRICSLHQTLVPHELMMYIVQLAKKHNINLDVTSPVTHVPQFTREPMSYQGNNQPVNNSNRNATNEMESVTHNGQTHAYLANNNNNSNSNANLSNNNNAMSQSAVKLSELESEPLASQSAMAIPPLQMLRMTQGSATQAAMNGAMPTQQQPMQSQHHHHQHHQQQQSQLSGSPPSPTRRQTDVQSTAQPLGAPTHVNGAVSSSKQQMPLQHLPQQHIALPHHFHRAPSKPVGPIVLAGPSNLNNMSHMNGNGDDNGSLHDHDSLNLNSNNHNGGGDLHACHSFSYYLPHSSASPGGLGSDVSLHSLDAIDEDDPIERMFQVSPST